MKKTPLYSVLRIPAASVAALVFSAVASAPNHAAAAKTGQPRAVDRGVALTPEAALAAFQLEPGLRIELVAAEPLVVDPVAFAFDEQGRLYVAEARGYPETLGANPPTTEGRVARLEDTDGDGRYDRRTEFATGFTNPNGIMGWKGGVFVTCAPDIFYLKDTNGDGIADERRVVLTGFDKTRTSQIRVSFPTLGLDGRVYLACGSNGGTITSPEHPERPAVVFTPTDGRFDPETFVYETIGGRGQFGLAIDAYGRRFDCTNRHPVLQTVLEPGQLKRNPHLAFAETSQEVSKVQAAAKVFPISRVSVTADFAPNLMSTPHAGSFTSACGVMVFGGAGLSPEHVGNVFICEPAQNLVQRQVFRLEGASFRSDPPYTGREFLASTDSWFRPVFVASGPDGAFYVADMHRREIDHPSYVPEEARGRLDFNSGEGTGRIYRIVKADLKVKATVAGRTTAALCRDLESPNSWSRETAQRLLIEKPDPAAVPLLEKCAAQARLPESRTRALWTLQNLRRLSPATIALALRDSAAGVREQAVALAVAALDQSPEFRPRLIALADDPDTRVRFVAALALGSMTDAAAVPALATIAARDGEDRWARAAVLSGIGTRMPEFLEAMGKSRQNSSPAFAAVMEDLGRTMGAGAPLDSCRRFLAQMLNGDGDLAWRVPSVVGLADGLRGRRDLKVKAGGNPLIALLAEGTDSAAPVGLDDFFNRAAKVAADAEASTRQRGSAIALLSYTEFSRGGAPLGDLLGGGQPLDLQLQAIKALERFGDPRGAEILIQPQNWSRYTPRVREAVISALVARPKMTEILFTAIQGGAIKPSEISSSRRTRLLKHTDPAIRQAAEKLFQGLDGGDRMQVYKGYREVLGLTADMARGGKVFERACSACHTYNGTGGKVGPDLTGIRNQPADALLLHIIVPNLEIAPAYSAVSVTTTDGRSISGNLVGETDSGLTLRTAFGTDESVLRSNVALLSSLGLSLMPDGLEQTMTKPEMADLIAYLKTGVDL